jgi:translation initiation factor 3 subunit D
MSFELPFVSANKLGWGPSINKTNNEDSLQIVLPPSLNHNLGSSNITSSLKVLVADWTSTSSTSSSTSHTGFDHRRTYRGGGDSSFNDATATFTGTGSGGEAFTVVAHQASQSGSTQNPASKRKQAWAVQKEHQQSQLKTYTVEQQKQIHRTQKKVNRNRYYMATASRQQREAQQAQHYRSVTTSIAVKPDWRKVASFPFKNLNSMNLDTADLPTVEDIKFCGTLESYDKRFDRITTKTPVSLKATNRTYIDSTTTEDPIIGNLPDQSAKDDFVRLYATDQILALLVSASRTVYTWDIVIRKIGNNIYLDKRPGIPSIDLLTVNENSVRDAPSVDERDKKNINSAMVVSQEAADVNANFVQLVLNPKARVELAESSPFSDVDAEEQAPVGYRYRRWTFKNSKMVLIARTEVDAVVDSTVPANERKYMTIKSMNEYFGAHVPSNWRGQLDSQRSAILLTEYKNNAAKMTRFAVQALLAGTDVMKVGFISRVKPTSKTQHSVLGTETYLPASLARTVKLESRNMWGVIQGVMSIVAKQEGDGVFVLLHPPNKQQLELYHVNDEADLEPSDDNSTYIGEGGNE